MKHVRIFLLTVALTFAVGALAQGGAAAKPSSSPAPQAQTAPEPASLASVVDSQISQYEKNVGVWPKPCRMTNTISPPTA